MSFAQGAPTQPLNLTASNVFVTGSSAVGNAFTVQQLGAGNVASFQTSTTSTALIINPSGQVGIGKTNPAYAMDITGDLNFTGTFRQNGTPYIGSQWTGTTSLYFVGNVGINTTSVANPLTVGGTVVATTLNLTNALGTAYGGTGQTTASAGFNALSPMTTAGDLIYGGASGSGTRLGAGTGTQVLHSGTTPSWGSVSLTADVSGTLPITNGGTGATSTSQNYVFAGPTSGSGTPSFRALASGDIPNNAANTSGTAAGISGSQTANYVYAAPNGSSGTASFRALVSADVPTLNQNTTGTAGSANILLRTTDARAGAAPSGIGGSQMQLFFTTYTNNNTGNFADGILMNSWIDSSGGSTNMLSINKGGAGIRQYQGTFNSGTAFSTYYDALMVNSSGQIQNYTSVGIGASPGYPLQVNSTATGSSTTAAFLTPSLGTGGAGNFIQVGGAISSSQAAAFGFLNYGGNSSNVAQISINGTGSSAINITTGGVGIGLTNPGSALEVNGVMRFTGTSTSLAGINLPTGGAGIHWGNGYSRIYDDGDLRICTDDNMHFYNGCNTTSPGTERITMLASGNVGIGTTNPTSYTLQVAGTIGASGDITALYSDERLKTKTGTLENALDKVCSLDTFTYRNNELAQSFGFKDDYQRVGVSAQQVQKVIPEAVRPAPFDAENQSGQNYLTVQYEKLVPLLIEALKEERAERLRLQDRLERLEKLLSQDHTQ